MNYYHKIKEQLINNEIYKSAKDYSKNRSDLNTYYNVGKLLNDAGKHYGEGIIKEYSIKLTNELGKGYTPSRLRYYRRFYVVFSKCPTLSDKLSFSHYCEMIWLKENEINYYINISIKQNLSVRELREKIKNKEYERLPNSTKNKLINNKGTKVTDFVKNPIVIKNNLDTNDISEKILKKLILEDIDGFLKELGDGCCYIANEYKMKLCGRYNYIDLLLFNYIFNSFVVVELKVIELKKEHIGQIQVYMNYINKNIKSINHNNTIGIIISKEDNKFIINYCSDSKIFSTSYILQ